MILDIQTINSLYIIYYITITPTSPCISFHTKANYVNSLFNDAMLQLLRADHGVNQNVN